MLSLYPPNRMLKRDKTRLSGVFKGGADHFFHKGRAGGRKIKYLSSKAKNKKGMRLRNNPPQEQI
jgi:hypothetical protein